MSHRYNGHIYVISAPSGAGKTSLVSALMEALPQARMAVSHTTRKPRPGEQDGKDYYFISDQDFRERLHHSAFIEYARVFDHYYGTSKAEVERITTSGCDVILEIDWQGARQVKKLYPEQAVSIFILPPSLEALQGRLQRRGKDHETVIDRRMSQARDEIAHCPEYDYVVVNEDFDQACADLQAIIRTLGLYNSNQRARHLVECLVGS